MAKEKEYKCGYCSEIVLESEVVLVPDSKRRFHKDCAKKMEAKLLEKRKNDKIAKVNSEEFQKLESYIRDVYYNGDPLTKGMVLKLQAMRSGRDFTRKGDKVSKGGIKAVGYRYKIIYYAFKGSEDKIKYAINRKEYKNEQGKFLHMCAIVNSELPNIKKKLLRIKRERERLKGLKDAPDVLPYNNDEHKKENTKLKVDIGGLW